MGGPTINSGEFRSPAERSEVDWEKENTLIIMGVFL